MVRTQIQLEPEQLERLKRRAAELGVSVAELVRRGVEHVLADEERSVRWARAFEAVGVARSGVPDLGLRHDQYAWEDDPDGVR